MQTTTNFAEFGFSDYIGDWIFNPTTPPRDFMRDAFEKSKKECCKK